MPTCPPDGDSRSIAGWLAHAAHSLPAQRMPLCSNHSIAEPNVPAPPQMKDGDELTAVPEGGDSRRQMAELGPLFATVFGSKAAAAAGANAKPELL